ncbi:MAG: 4'-phosphopantetheinyl transferase superfamily protein [Sterolibacterium sp.]|nr:4'-phosphopantetheinyl transferase superfamily protein [Sterolibacterium sp.]
MALCAVVGAGELGVDIEWCRELPYDNLARRFFAPDESTSLKALAEEDRVAGFFSCWTRKEAYIKAKGLGLSLPLRSFSVTTCPRQVPALLSSQHEPSDVGRYRFWEVPVAPGYRAALAYRGNESEPPRYIDWASSC